MTATDPDGDGEADPDRDHESDPAPDRRRDGDADSRPDAAIRFDGVTVDYGDGPVVEDVAVAVEAGEVVCLLGPNGAGKSTLLQAALRLVEPDAGTVAVGGDAVTDLDRRELARRVGYVPQAESQRTPATVFEAVLMGRRPYVAWRASEADRAVVARTLAALDLADLATRDVRTLSGGQRRKVLVARALAQEPDALVLDEPTSDLDVRHELELLEVVREAAAAGRAALLAMHDLTLAARVADRLVLLRDGGVYDAGAPGDVLTREAVRDVYGVDAEVRRDGTGVSVVPQGPAE